MKKYTPHLGQASLVEACGQPGCPICSISKKSINTYLQTVLAAYVDAPDLRQQLCDSWGYCHNHAWMLSTTVVLPAPSPPTIARIAPPERSFRFGTCFSQRRR